MSPRAASTPPLGCTEAGGFVLVGVAMFVLVLTILGLSLFSLSGFEAQFFARSNERSKAFNAAASGIERARFALLATDSLQPVWQHLPGGGLEYPVAVQGADTPPTPEGVFVDGDSLGVVDWGGEDIWIRAVARVGQARVVLQARFSPHEPEDYYKRLFTTEVMDPVGANESRTYVSGAVMQPASADTSWNNPPGPPSVGLRPPIRIHPNPMPLPDLAAYFTAKEPLSQLVDIPGGSGHYTLNAGVGIGYFHLPSNAGDDWTVDEDHPTPRITVSGTAVWLAKPGLNFHHQVQIDGIPGALLIVVARPKDAAFERALRFLGGVVSNVPMIVVTDGSVWFDSQDNVSTMLPYLSVYAHRVTLWGPESPARMDLMHTPSLLPVQAEPLIDQLYQAGVLPTANVGTFGRLTQVPGTWQERNSSN